MNLVRGEGVAAWRQIADALREEIRSGAIGQGSRLPTEADMAARFGVNRHTVRRALAGLATEGLVRTTQGRGTFVEAAPLVYPLTSRTRFSEIVTLGGRDPGGTLLDARTGPASSAVATALGLATGAPVLSITTLRSADGIPLSIGRSCMPLPRFAGLEAILAQGVTWSGAMERLGAGGYRRLETRITARTATPEEAVRLQLAEGRTVLVVDSVNEDDAGVPIQATEAIFAADRVTVLVEA